MVWEPLCYSAMRLASLGVFDKGFGSTEKLKYTLEYGFKERLKRYQRRGLCLASYESKLATVAELWTISKGT